MAINYSAGLNPMYDRFSQQIQQASNTQKQAQLLAMQRENNRYQKLAELGGAIGSAVRSNAKAEVDQFKKDTSAEQKRLETLRDKFVIGSDSYLKLNNQIAGIKDKRDEQIQAYSDSGFLGFGRDSEELDLYKKDEAKKKESGKGFLRSAFEGNKRDTEGMFKKKKAVTNNAESRIAQNNEAIAKKREAIEKVRTANNPGTDPMVNPMGVPLSAEKSEQLTGLATGLAGEINSLERENKKLMKSVDNPKNVEKEQKKQRFLGEGFTDPNSGIQLNNKDLVTQEQRRYQENKEKEAREVQKKEARIARSAQMKLKLGMNLNEDERAYYQDFDDIEFAELQEEAQESEFQQDFDNAVKFGKTFDENDKRTKQIAKSLGVKPADLNSFINEQFEDGLYQDIQRAGTDYKALERVQSKTKGKNLPNLTEDRMQTLVEEAKQANRDEVNTDITRAVASSDLTALDGYLTNSDPKLQKLFKDGVLDEKRFNERIDLIRKQIIQPKKDKVALEKQSQVYDQLQDDLKAFKKGGGTQALRDRIITNANLLNIDGNNLLTSEKARQDLTDASNNLTNQTKSLEFQNKIRNRIYDHLYGKGVLKEQIEPGTGPLASPRIEYLLDAKGLVDPNKAFNEWKSSLIRDGMPPPTPKEAKDFKESIRLLNNASQTTVESIQKSAGLFKDE